VEVHLVDGTYELFRHFHAVPSALDERGEEVAAARAVVASLLGMLESGASNVGVATDHVIESFRNALWPGYKTGAGVDARLLAQFGPLEEGLLALGVAVWPMVELEADDALAAAAAGASLDPRVARVLVCSPDKDLAQCVEGDRVVQLDRRRGLVIDEAAVVAKFGVPPASIPDYLALVGDAADGYPGLPGWGARSAAAVLSRYGRLEAIPPALPADLGLRSAGRLAATLREQRDLALLFRDLATLRREPWPFATVDDIAWKGPLPGFEAWCRRAGAPALSERARRLADARAAPP
jgi:5'-3' exonuclease